MAKKACDLALEPGRCTHIHFGFGGYARIRERRAAEWRKCHVAEGHSDYKGTLRDIRHLHTLSRLDIFALIRIRSGTGLVGHDDCINKDNRHHWTFCDHYLALRPAHDMLYDNLKLDPWIKWSWYHDCLGLGIPSNTLRSGNVSLAFGNPFDSSACIIWDGRYSTVDVASPTYRCEHCNKVHAGADCPLPSVRVVGALFFPPRK